jgi:predicted phage terminase large subunit-like protein
MLSVEKRKPKRFAVTEAQILTALYEQSFYEFFKAAWETIEPSIPFIDNWHFEVMCAEAQKEAERLGAHKPKTTDIICNVPPRSGKSNVWSVALNAWVWIRWPWQRFITASTTQDLTLDFSIKTRHLILSPFYQDRWGHLYKFREDQNTKAKFYNSHGGTRLSIAAGSNFIGKGADWIITDDWADPNKAWVSKKEYQESNRKYDEILYMRLNDQKYGVRVNVMQRLDMEDLTAHLLRHYPEENRLISIPATVKGKIHPPALKKHYKGGLFFGERFSQKEISKMALHLKQKAPAQLDQDPVPDDGEVFRDADFKFVYDELPQDLDSVWQSWDLTFDDGPNAAFVVGQVWAVKWPNCYLVFQRREQMDFPDTIKAIEEMTERYPLAVGKLIERKANGAAAISVLESRIPGLIAIEPQGSKVARAISTTPWWRAGNVWMPREEKAPWLQEYISEHKAFPNGKKNDQVDTTSQFLNYVRNETAYNIDGMVLS